MIFLIGEHIGICILPKRCFIVKVKVVSLNKAEVAYLRHKKLSRHKRLIETKNWIFATQRANILLKFKFNLLICYADL